MSLDDWDKHYQALMDEEIESYLTENADVLFKDDPMKPKELQKQQSREELMRMFRLEDAAESIDRALGLIISTLPQRLTPDDWEEVLNEFLSCDDALCDFFEKDANGEISQEDYIPIHQMCGISTYTLKLCYELGQWYFAEKDFDDARCIFAFLTTVAPYMPEFWISLGMSYTQMQQYDNAINSYKTAQKLFKNDPAMYIHCANNYIANGCAASANNELDEVSNIFSESPGLKGEWERTYDYLRSRSLSNYKKLV